MARAMIRTPDLLIAGQRQRLEDAGRPQQRDTATRHDALFDRRLGGVHRVFDASLLFLHLGLGRRAHLDHGHAADQFRQPFLQFFAIVVRAGVIDLRPQLLDAAFDGLPRARRLR